jgi:hypothetical protein
MAVDPGHSQQQEVFGAFGMAALCWGKEGFQAVLCALFVLTLSACTYQSLNTSEHLEAESSSDVYRALNGKSFIPCYKKKDSGWCGESLFLRPARPGLDTGYPAAEDSWYDCSDADFSCVTNPIYLLAVPRTGLTQGLVYKTHGFELTVLKCFEDGFGGPNKCQTALIATRCVGSCECLPEQMPRFGVLFYYAEDIGVSAFMFTPSIDEMDGAIPWRSWGLIAERGFLARDFGLPPVGSARPCHFE